MLFILRFICKHRKLLDQNKVKFVNHKVTTSSFQDKNWLPYSLCNICGLRMQTVFFMNFKYSVQRFFNCHITVVETFIKCNIHYMLYNTHG